MMSGGDNDGQMIFGDLEGLKLPHICLTGEEKPRKILTQTCPDWGLYAGPLHDRRAYYRLSHSGGLFGILKNVLHHLYHLSNIVNGLLKHSVFNNGIT